MTIDPFIFNWFILPLLIFLARTCDVSLGTIRIILLSKGKKLPVALLGFVEMIIWLLAVRQIFLNLANPACFFAFAGGFAFGNYVGLMLEEKIAMGVVIVRVITVKNADALFHALVDKKYRVTHVPAQGAQGPVSIMFTVVKRAEMNNVIAMIKEFNPNAFYTIEDIRSINEDFYGERRSRFGKFSFLKK